MTVTREFLQWELVNTDSQLNFTINPDTGDIEIPVKDGIRKGEVINYVVGARMKDGSIVPYPMRTYVFE